MKTQTSYAENAIRTMFGTTSGKVRAAAMRTTSIIADRVTGDGFLKVPTHNAEVAGSTPAPSTR